MNYAIEHLIELANAEVGYLEKKSNSQLDDKTANAGRNNYTKYARDLYKAGYISWNPNGQPWCVVFVAWLFFMLCGKDVKKTLKLACQSTGNALCSTSMNGYKKAGRFFKSPQPGDQIFFYEGKGPGLAHTGFVYKVDSSKVYTIEGNTSGYAGVVANGGCVAKKSYSLSYYKIAGYGRPRFDDTEISIAVTVTPESFFNIYIGELLATNAKIDITYTEKLTCSWVSELTNVKNGKIDSNKLKQLGDSLTFNNLIPNTLYAVKLTADTGSYTQEQQIFFATPQELPDTVTDLNVTFSEIGDLNRNCDVTFNMPKSAWGTYSKNNRDKGYRTYLIVNGTAIAYNDSLITYTTANKVSKSFNFSSISSKKVAYNNIVQIGIQTWVKDESGNILLSGDGPACSEPIYLKHSLTAIDKIYIGIKGAFNRALLYLSHFENR